MIQSLKDHIIENLKPLRFIFKKIKFSVVIVPQTSTSRFKSRTLNFPMFLVVMALYSLLVFFISGMLLIYTPARHLFFSENVSLTYSEIKENEALVDKVDRLVNELDELKLKNERLRNAILLGDSTAFRDVIKPPPNSKKAVKYVGGDIFSMFAEFFFPEQKSDLVSFVKPMDGVISNKFSPDKGHYGLDIAAKEGTPVYASANGYVVFSGYTTDDGMMVILAHPGDHITVYKHCSGVLARPRQKIVQGEVIALCGNTGSESHGAHLHFEIWRYGSAVNPQTFIPN